MKKKLVIFGAGGFGREVAWQFEQVENLTENYDLVGFVDDTLELQGELVNGIPVLGGIDYLINATEEIAVVISIGNSKFRKMIYEKIRVNQLISFPTIIASDVQYSNTVKFGKGCIICLSNILTVNIELGDFVVSNLDCTIGHDVVLDDFVTLFPSVNVSGNTNIGSCSEIGTGTNIIQGKKIGSNSIIGAGAVVIKDIPDNCTAVGAPAVPIKYHS